MQELLRRAKQDAFLQSLSDSEVWTKWESMANKERFAEGLTLSAKSAAYTMMLISNILLFQLLIRALCDFAPDEVNKVISCLTPVLASLFEPQRVSAAAFFAEVYPTELILM